MTSPVYVAIDTPDLAKAQHLAGQVRHHVGGLKLGLEFFCANGHHGVHEMTKFGLPIFLDLKLHYIHKHTSYSQFRNVCLDSERVLGSILARVEVQFV